MNSLYALILVNVLGGLAEPTAVTFETYPSVDRCIAAGQALIVAYSESGNFPAGLGAACVELPTK